MWGVALGVFLFWGLVAVDAQATSCGDAILNGNETDVDCGGNACPRCPTGRTCFLPTDCASSLCSSRSTCMPTTCADHLKDGNETDVDCGGACEWCALGQSCLGGQDCESKFCTAGVCTAFGAATGGGPNAVTHDAGDETPHDASTPRTIRDATAGDATEDASWGSTRGSGGASSQGGAGAGGASAGGSGTGGYTFIGGPKPTNTGGMQQGTGGTFYATGGDSSHPATTGAGSGGTSSTAVADASASDQVVQTETVHGGCGCRTSSHDADESAATAFAALAATAFARRSPRGARSRRRTLRDTPGGRSPR